MPDLNKFFKNILIILLIFYIVYFIPNLNTNIISEFNNIYIRILCIVVIVLTGVKDPLVSLLLSVCFVLMHIRLQQFVKLNEISNNDNKVKGNDYSFPTNIFDTIFDNTMENYTNNTEDINQDEDNSFNQNEDDSFNQNEIDEMDETDDMDEIEILNNIDDMGETDDMGDMSNTDNTDNTDNLDNTDNTDNSGSSLVNDDPLENNLDNSLDNNLYDQSNNVFEDLDHLINYTDTSVKIDPYDKDDTFKKIEYNVSVTPKEKQLNKIDQINNKIGFKPTENTQHTELVNTILENENNEIEKNKETHNV